MDVAQSLHHLEKPVKAPTSFMLETSNQETENRKPGHVHSAPDHALKKGLTFENQDSLPKLPIPDLEDTCRRYLDSLSALQTPREHAETKAAVEEFLKTDGPVLQEKLKNYASSKTSYIEQFCMSAHHSPDPPVLTSYRVRFLLEL